MPSEMFKGTGSRGCRGSKSKASRAGPQRSKKYAAYDSEETVQRAAEELFEDVDIFGRAKEHGRGCPNLERLVKKEGIDEAFEKVAEYRVTHKMYMRAGGLDVDSFETKEFSGKALAETSTEVCNGGNHSAMKVPVVHK